MTRYRFQEHLGSGGFGSVRRAERLDEDGVTILDGQLAVKHLNPAFAGDTDALARFRREVELLGERLDHPNVMPILDHDLAASPPWFVMPLAETNLADELAAGRGEDRGWLRRIYGEVLTGLAHAHERGVIHRDVKPPNVLFCGGEVKVSDFGLGKRLDPDATNLTKTATWMGTEPYMAPEQFADAKHIDASADVYALGKLLWEMLVGQPPPILHVDSEAVPAEYRFFLDKCTRRDPAERFPDAGAALIAFQTLSEGAVLLEPPLERAETILAECSESTDAEERLTLLRRLDEHLARHSSNEELYRRLVPALPDDLLSLYLTAEPDRFLSLLRAFEQHLEVSLDFSYCDVIARFYRRVYQLGASPDVQRLLLARLISLGAENNRWFVGEVTAELLAGIRDVSAAMLAAEVIEANPYHAAWFWDPWLKDRPLMAPIATAIEQAQT